MPNIEKQGTAQETIKAHCLSANQVPLPPTSFYQQNSSLPQLSLAQRQIPHQPIMKPPVQSPTMSPPQTEEVQMQPKMNAIYEHNKREINSKYSKDVNFNNKNFEKELKDQKMIQSFSNILKRITEGSDRSDPPAISQEQRRKENAILKQIVQEEQVQNQGQMKNNNKNQWKSEWESESSGPSSGIQQEMELQKRLSQSFGYTFRNISEQSLLHEKQNIVRPKSPYYIKRTSPFNAYMYRQEDLSQFVMDQKQSSSYNNQPYENQPFSLYSPTPQPVSNNCSQKQSQMPQESSNQVINFGSEEQTSELQQKESEKQNRKPLKTVLEMNKQDQQYNQSDSNESQNMQNSQRNMFKPEDILSEYLMEMRIKSENSGEADLDWEIDNDGEKRSNQEKELQNQQSFFNDQEKKFQPSPIFSSSSEPSQVASNLQSPTSSPNSQSLQNSPNSQSISDYSYSQSSGVSLDSSQEQQDLSILMSNQSVISSSDEDISSSKEEKKQKHNNQLIEQIHSYQNSLENLPSKRQIKISKQIDKNSKRLMKKLKKAQKGDVGKRMNNILQFCEKIQQTFLNFMNLVMKSKPAQ